MKKIFKKILNGLKKVFKKILSGLKKIVTVIKKKWLIKMTTTIILMAIFIAIFILTTSIMQSLNLDPIDVTSEGINSLTDETKEKLANIDKEVTIYMMDYTESDSTYKLAMQYENVNKNINVELIDLSTRTDLAQAYNVSTEDSGTIVIVYEEKYKTISSSDLYTYDYTTYDTIDLTEETITSTIINITAEKLSNVYVLDNYCSEYFTTSTYMSGLSEYMEKEAVNVDNLDLLVTGKVPDDCDLLLIISPLEDFETQTADEIIEYINKGGNILWLQGAYGSELSLPNVQRVLELYGVKSFTSGYIIETDSSNTLSGYLDAIILNVYSNEITGYDSLKALFLDATKINVSDEETLDNLKVTETDIITTADTTLFRTDFTSSSTSKISSDEQGSFILGAIFEKDVTPDSETEDTEETTEESTEETTITSQLVIYSNDYFASSMPYSQYYSNGWIDLYNNKDIVLNTVSYLTDSDIDITIRKSTNTQYFTMTDKEYSTTLLIIFIIPILIIIFGIVVWQIRRRKK